MEIFKLLKRYLKYICLGCNVLGIIILILIGLFVIFSPKSEPPESTEKPSTTTQHPILDPKICEEYTKFACENPFKPKYQERTVIGKYPHTVYVHIAAPGTSTVIFFCGGALISKNFVLTAAYCVQDMRMDFIFIKVGSSRKIFSDEFITEDIYRAKKIHVYYGFHRKYPMHDLALIELDRDVEFSVTVRPICLSTRDLDINASNVTTSGWGYNVERKHTEHAVFVRWKLANETICRDRWAIYNILPCLMICAQNFLKRYDLRMCKIDSGTSLQVPLNTGCPNTYELIGIGTRYGEFCDIGVNGTTFDLFTKVENYIPWIASIVWPEPMEKQPIAQY